ncbi:SnoaL-like domain-containing protein [Terrimicrobium sacchariphilum]|uniref:SnoaL-like domain-containing protein n=1 Tax=Terrimicrobium sacchariphilum TaxID=690879 RepID=A0A146G868_TERSA|nr:nuclear transport factor 2 family protein [Terrimicrobium sacchariphilum]GAT33522.1 SnoaL-like domain-containing protein [Terrimicrobium sacchariphilum]
MTTSNSSEVPAPLADYIEAANAGMIEPALASFSETAVVQDEGGEYCGHVAIRDWIKETVGKYQFRVTPLAVHKSGDHVVVQCQVGGSFPGSPVQLDFDTVVSGGKISHLSIR